MFKRFASLPGLGVALAGTAAAAPYADASTNHLYEPMFCDAATDWQDLLYAPRADAAAVRALAAYRDGRVRYLNHRAVGSR